MADSAPGLKYKGKPLFRDGDTIYYGSMSDKYIVMLQILDKEMVNGVPQATKVMVYLQLTDPNLLPAKKIVRKSEKEKRSLFEAMDVGTVWLNRALSGKI